jgi:GNAT superfamily N-acetyltransferase
VDASTPELAIAVVAAHRRKGVGRALLEELIGTARADGFPALSLSVSPLNPALKLYVSLGFRKVGETGSSWTLRLSLGWERRARAANKPLQPAACPITSRRG